jgi:hypothetical protein
MQHRFAASHVPCFQTLKEQVQKVNGGWFHKMLKEQVQEVNGGWFYKMLKEQTVCERASASEHA